MNKILILLSISSALVGASHEQTKAVQMFCVKRMLTKKLVPRAQIFLKLTKQAQALLDVEQLRAGKTGIEKLDNLNARYAGLPVSLNQSRLGIGFEKNYPLPMVLALYRKQGKTLWEVETQEPTKRAAHSVATISVELTRAGTAQHNAYKESENYSPEKTGYDALDSLNAIHNATLTGTFWNSAGNLVFTFKFSPAIADTVIDEYKALIPEDIVARVTVDDDLG